MRIDGREICRQMVEQIGALRGSVPLKDFLSLHNARACYDDGLDPVNGEIREPSHAWTLLRRLQLQLRLGFADAPWHAWRPGSRVVVLLGERLAQIEEVSSSVKQRCVGARDVAAFRDLLTICHNRLRLSCRIDLELLPSPTTDAEALRKIQSLMARPDVGMIAVLGSPVVNPAANAIALTILQDPKEPNKSEQPPALFRWAFQHPPWFLAQRPLGDKRWKRNQEGIQLRPHAHRSRTDYTRVGDDDILKDRSGRRRFKDCGLLLLRQSHGKILLLAAGHGGIGTVAAVEQLEHTEDIARRISRGGNRLVAVVQVDRIIPRELRDAACPVDTVADYEAKIVWDEPSCLSR